MTMLGICLVLCSTTGAAQPEATRFAPDDISRQLRAPWTSDVRLAPDLHLRLLVDRATASPLTDPDAALRHRFASSMIDFYPQNGRGLRISAGMRFYSVSNAARDAELMTHGLLYTPRLGSSAGGTRAGFRRRTPAMTIGYSWTSHENLFIGLEGGAVMGRLNSSPPRGLDHEADQGRVRAGINPVANLAFALKF